MSQPDRRPGPDFLCVGAQKAGTHWLYDQLQHHPDFWMPPLKELHYFDAEWAKRQSRKARKLLGQARADSSRTNAERAGECDRPIEPRDIEFLTAFARLSETGKRGGVTKLLKKGTFLASRVLSGSRLHRTLWLAAKVRRRPDFHEYASLFSQKGLALSGDITPGYSVLDSKAVRNIVQAFPGLKVVFFARDPVERFWSAVAMHVRVRDEEWPQDARALERLLRKPNHFHRSYQTRVFSRWRRLLPTQDVGLFLFDDLLADPELFRMRVLTFLGGDAEKPSGDLPPGFNRKAASPKRPLTDEFRSLLGQFFADELRASAAEFGGSAIDWPAKYGLTSPREQ